MVQQKESIFKERVIKDLKTLRDAWFFKSQEVAVHGIPDIVICLGGLFVALELKSSFFEKAGELQDYHLKRINACGGRAFLVNPGTWPTIFASLSAYDADNLKRGFGPLAPSP